MNQLRAVISSACLAVCACSGESGTAKPDGLMPGGSTLTNSPSGSAQPSATLPPEATSGSVTAMVSAAIGAPASASSVTSGTPNVSASEGVSENPLGTAAATASSAPTATRPDGSVSATASTPIEPPPVVRPALVTSGEGAYWVEGQLTEMASATADLSVADTTTYQEWLGFGGTFNEAGWDALSVVSDAERARAIRLLFDANEGANFAFGRIPMGASDYALERYTLNDNAGDYAMAQFSIDHDRQLLIPFIKAAMAVKADIEFWASPWSPPAWMKVNNSIDGGRITDDPMTLEAYGLYFARFVEEYALEGIAVRHVLPQNEPGYETRYPSCLWTPELLRDFVRDYLGPTLLAHEVQADIWFGTMSAPEDSAHLDAVLADPIAASFVKGFGLQWNTLDSVSKLAVQNLPIIQSEHKCGNYHWLDTFNPDRPPNDHAYAEESWGLIRDWVTAGVHVYSAWNMVLDTLGHNSDPERPWPQNALLTVDRATKTLTLTPAYYVFRHLSYFVDRGAVRLGITGNGDALAFRNPDGSLVTIVYNAGGQAKLTTLGVSGTKLQFEVPAHGWATVNWK